ncbi:hypothetical protein O6H91_12G068500 [Diphasiastrum complanatum]|uniref:Uncharacterized protein n=1 Tax=Diphasiastrum complanatum TaxID=34168 RepID=A0ACC2C327_DIPCM|nr:hypothetical protein O6H91_12G068500 [Diphasiastrum complanatum]
MKSLLAKAGLSNDGIVACILFYALELYQHKSRNEAAILSFLLQISDLPRKYTESLLRLHTFHFLGSCNEDSWTNSLKGKEGLTRLSDRIFTKETRRSMRAWLRECVELVDATEMPLLFHSIRGRFFHSERKRSHSRRLNNKKRRGWLFLVASAMVALMVFSWTTDFAASTAWALTEENLIFLEAWRVIDRAYVDKTFNGQSWFRYREDALRHEPMNSREETYAAIRKMLASLNDPYTRFLEPEKFQSLRAVGTSGAVTGVGLEVGFDSSSGVLELVVVAPVVGGPAARAGVVPGDVILAIDGVNVEGMSLYEAAQRLQGPDHSLVELTLLDKGPKQFRTIQLRREKVTLNPVTWDSCDVSKDGDNFKLGYIRLSTFNQNSIRSLKDAIERLREIGVAAYVLDIRNNSGGLFPAAIDIAKMWLDKGVIVYISDSKGVRDIYESDGTGVVASTEPLAVLVNKGTASASEILAGALKDNRRAVILGEPTFGKGKIQSVFELSDGSGMAVTVARYKTPANIDIDKVGIPPDFPLPFSIPMDGEGFCKCLEETTVECNFSPKVLFTRP